MEGLILGNRYELLEKIGGGGMAVVYKARCRLLNRYVAVKILRNEFTNDEEFVKRFRVEAQSVASLSHPNIVSIYDVGQEDNIYYIVMEYINGITLKDYINQKGALRWDDSVDIAIQICCAIEHAHRNHIVHRDIKPHNILLTSEGIAKVTDFGIARAVSSSTITMVGSTIGSVHYFSPEQARGGFTDEKSDLYSLGIALYEMATGKLPFNGDTPVAVALKHIQDKAVQPVEINEKIPKGLNDIIIKAIKKDQSNRYQTATDMLVDLYKVIKEPGGDFVVTDKTGDSPTRRVKIINNSISNGEDGILMDKEDENKVKKKSEKATVWLAILTSVILISIITYYIGFKIVIPPLVAEKEEFKVENYAGRDYNDVYNVLLKAGISDIRKSTKFDDDIPKNIIISQKPPAGKVLKLGGFNNYVELEVSDGPNLVKMPDLKNMDYRDAEGRLSDLGLVSTTVDEFNETVGVNMVIRTEPYVDTEVKVGSNAIIFKSTGPENLKTVVPNLIGKTRTEAQKLLSNAKLVIGNVYPEDSSNYIDKIDKQSPSSGTEVNEGDAVNLYLVTSSSNIQEVKKEEPKRVTVKETINLVNKDNYGNKIKIKVDALYSDTNKSAVLVDGIINKSDFPYTFSIFVPVGGKTVITIYLDGLSYQKFTRYSSEVR